MKNKNTDNESFKRSLELVLKSEGGFVNHPDDPGEATNKGITIRTYKSFFGERKTVKDLKVIKDEEVESIYREDYWDKCKCDRLPKGIDFLVFDAAVNSGPSRSIKWLQMASESIVDGLIGKNTIHNVWEEYFCTSILGSRYRVLFIIDLCERRFNFLENLKTFEVFGKGWNARIDKAMGEAIQMSLEDK